MGEMMFAIFYTAGPKWIEGRPLRERPFWPHNAYLKSLFSAGQLAFAGVTADADEFLGIVFLCVETKEIAQDLVARDPAVISGLFKGELRPWLAVFDRAVRPT